MPEWPLLTMTANTTTVPTRAQCSEASKRPGFLSAPLLKPSRPQSATAAGAIPENARLTAAG